MLRICKSDFVIQLSLLFLPLCIYGSVKLSQVFLNFFLILNFFFKFYFFCLTLYISFENLIFFTSFKQNISFTWILFQWRLEKIDEHEIRRMTDAAAKSADEQIFAFSAMATLAFCSEATRQKLLLHVLPLALDLLANIQTDIRVRMLIE